MNIEERRAYQRAYYQRPSPKEKKRQYNARYQREHSAQRAIINNRWKQENKDKVLAAAKRHSDKHPEQVHAVAVAQYIQKASACFCCGGIKHLQKHHPDYSKPREIITLCAKCHNRLHKLFGTAVVTLEAIIHSIGAAVARMAELAIKQLETEKTNE